MGFGIRLLRRCKGTVLVDEKSWKVVDPEGKEGEKTPSRFLHRRFAGRAHFRNFIECVRSREKPNAEIEIGHMSTRLCHLGNIAHRTGRKLTFDAATETFPGDDEVANKLLARVQQAVRDRRRRCEALRPSEWDRRLLPPSIAATFGGGRQGDTIPTL